ncbi:hypothetical protein ACIHEJ_32610 [Streptomyces sp. NPDC052301]|uniref:hypothetical protein n=1 Tax=Streptomyces sp. NPDC052301 TaxID=3365687 RepID=UPI0037CE2F42
MAGCPPATSAREWAAIGRPYGERAGVADRIDVRLAPAPATLRTLDAGPVVGIAYREDRHPAMRRLNDLITADARADSVVLPVRDGVTIARRR